MKHAFLVVALVGGLLSAFSFAQRDTGEIAGTVTDPSGAVVQNAQVVLKNSGTGLERTTATSDSGFYVISALPPGNYDLTVSTPGFARYKQPLVVTIGSRLTADVRLVVSSTSQAVTVEAAGGAVEVNTQDAQISSVVNPTEMVDLPSLTRNPYDFVNLTGALGSDPNGSTGGRGVGFSMNGQRSASTDITLDGAENVDTFSASVGQNIPLDSVQEYRVLTSGFNANYGRASGGMVNLETKSGTNNFHGSLYEYNRTSTFASNTFAEDVNNAAYRAGVAGLTFQPHDFFVRNQFGYSVGGPIKKNKLFFFSNTEWTRIRSSGSITDVVPTPAFLASSAPATQAFFTSFGALRSGAVLGAPVIPGGWTGNGSCGPTCAPLQQVTYVGPTNAGAGNPQNTYSSMNRIDFNISNTTTLSGRYAVEKDNLFPGVISTSAYSGYDTGETDLNQNILITLTHSFTSNFLSSTKFSYNRLNDLQPLSSVGAHPTLYLNQANVASIDSTTGYPITFPGYLPESPGSGIPFGGPQNQYQIYEDLTWTHGRHSVQFGGGFIQIRDNRTFGAYENAVEVVAKNGTDEATALATLQQGTMYQFLGAVNPEGKYPCVRDYSTGNLIQTANCQVTLPVGPPKFERANRYNDANFYLQDTWKVTPRLTFTPGLRWEYYGVQHSNGALDSNFYMPSGALTPENVVNGSVQLASQSRTGGLWEKHPHDFAPRLGLAWDPKGDGKMSVRAGYGIAFERNFGNVTYNVIQNPPNYAVLDIIQPGTPITTEPAGPLAGTGTAYLPPVSLRAPIQTMPTSFSQFYNASVERQMMQGALLSLEYSGSRGDHLYSIYNMNMDGYGEAILGLPPTAYNEPVGQPLNPQYGAINQRGANGDSYYNALNLRFEVSRFASRGMQLEANYTYAHSIDDLSSTFSESYNNFNLGYLNPWDPGEDRGNSDFDIRHRFVLGGVYAPKLLEFRGHSHLFQTLLGGWEFAPIFTVRSGSPFTLYDCTNGFFACPNVVPAAGLSRTGHAVPNAEFANGVDSYNYLYIPPAAANPYTDPILGRSDLPTCSSKGCTIPIGMQRNSWYSPAYWMWDQGIYKNFKVGERYNFQLRGEFYNITNHKNMYVVPGNADIAELPGGYVLGIKGSPGGNGGPGPLDERRNLQLALRFQF
jgi:outer membrane receptor protein involved in Fe transport